MSKVLVFGDSITWGAIDTEGGGWVERLRLYMWRKGDVDIYNLGVSGEKTPDLLERFEPETKARIKEDEETIVIFAIGINDSYFIHSKNDFITPIEKFKENIGKLINLAQKFSSKIIFVGLTPVDESRTTPIPWNTDKSYKNESVKKYDEVINSVCKNKNIPFIEIFDNWMKSNYQILLEDGLHPNSEGHKNIFEVVRDFLVQNKLIKI